MLEHWPQWDMLSPGFLQTAQVFATEASLVVELEGVDSDAMMGDFAWGWQQDVSGRLPSTLRRKETGAIMPLEGQSERRLNRSQMK